MNTRLFAFVGGDQGSWRVVGASAVAGAALPVVRRVEILSSAAVAVPTATAWVLRGVTSNERYVVGKEKVQLVATQEGLGRPGSTCAALIPIRKSEAWWALPQDERRHILEQRSAHIRTGLKYLPAIARRLHHCRDLGSIEPFDFITWFEFALSDAPAFDQLLVELRASEEWRYVEREIDIRLVRDPG